MVRVWVAGKTVWSPYYTRSISERFRDRQYRWVSVSAVAPIAVVLSFVYLYRQSTLLCTCL